MSARLPPWLPPLLIFPSFTALAAQFIFKRDEASQLLNLLKNQCTPALTSQNAKPLPCRLAYTGLGTLDGALCLVVAFVQSVLSDDIAKRYLTYALGVSTFLLALPAVESFRTRSRFLAYPVLWLLGAQVLSVGFAMPLYWLSFVLSDGFPKLRASGGTYAITKAHAEAIIFGLGIGATVCIAMVVLDDPTVTALWLPYPIYVSMFQALHLYFRPPSRYGQSGYPVIQVLYIGIFIISSSTHIATVLPILQDYDALSNLFVPSSSVLAPETPLAMRALDLLKWDFTFAWLSTMVASLWYASNLKELAYILLWYMVAVPLFGPGAAIMGVALKREADSQAAIHNSVSKRST